MVDERRKSPDIYKQAIKEAIYESTNDWLQRTYNAVGRWTIRGIGAFIFFVVVRTILMMHIPDFKQIVLEVIRP